MVGHTVPLLAALIAVVLAADWLFLDGTLNAHRTPPSPLARLLLAWERECARASLQEALAVAGRAAHIPGSLGHSSLDPWDRICRTEN